ncbi:type I restriction endonuclease subunit R [Arcobacter roscoffensis]|uniref:Type I restriction enzyme endonuclease subunit n=1 Tax=Arcobacter roscoffensis TaxID=2961520 RepID=A0ABY5E140_9BACT|nr:type I restriction endonuclease subunit R [Arcobacter roscoffensis]UTJ05587.1 type I restriction endonuclease subunit R [Arcobacter roscoffensis]
MAKQSEYFMEKELIRDLEGLGYRRVSIKNEDELLKNLKKQLERHNNIELSQSEFRRILNFLNDGAIVKRAEILRDWFPLKRDDGTTKRIRFFNMEKWCENEYQVTNQVTIEGTYTNRYDVTILINGLPLVQIELKRSGVALKEAFNQINRYQKDSFWASHGLFQYVQLFVISNRVNTKYFANDPDQTFKQTFFWTDEKNNSISDLKDFTKEFLEPCHVSTMIGQYIVVNETEKKLMILRPYQYYAVENIVKQVKDSVDGGYIWHTTGSGKTLTSFKASQIIKENSDVKKVLFVVDRKDLDYQTAQEFNSFRKGSVDSTDNTSKLIEQLTSNTEDTKLIVTTIQKLNNAISKDKFKEAIEYLQNEKVVFIFDECHRSQFGDTHDKIKEFFQNNQMFGFTGTPIFEDNAVKNEKGKRTTKDLFGKRLHTYVIKDAIKDENVLKFSVEYIGKYKQKEDSKTKIDIDVSKIDKKEAMESDDRIGKITDYIVGIHGRKTHHRNFTAMFCVGSVDAAIKYYELFKQKKENQEHNLNIATIFSYGQNEEPKESFGLIEEEKLEIQESKIDKTYKSKLESFIENFNKQFDTNHSLKDTQSYYTYYNDISKKVKNTNIDILIVVNMFLTGFDSKKLNTLYVDKNLNYHGLIQAFSRTNRIDNEQKSQGNIVCFRNLKANTDEAIALFNDEKANETVNMQDVFLDTYEEYLLKFKDALEILKVIAPTVVSVDELKDEKDELKFIKAFREILRLKNTMSNFSDFSWEDLGMSEQEFEDYIGKYLDLKDKVKRNQENEKESILDEVDFELELLHKDEINVAYILELLAKMKKGTAEDYHKQKEAVVKMMLGESKLRSKKELIEKFIDEHLIQLGEDDNLEEAFMNYWDDEQQKAINVLCEKEHLNKEGFNKLIGTYAIKKDEPRSTEIINLLEKKPSYRERKRIVERLKNKIKDFIEVFMDGVN